MKTNSKIEYILLMLALFVMGNFSSFAQHELFVRVEGGNPTDFERSIKFVTLSMKKTHQNGDIAYDKVRINRKKIIREGDFFKLSFLRKGEEDNTKWVDYQYKTSWSFFGGHILETEWANSNRKKFYLRSPFIKRELIVGVDPQNITDFGRFIKSVTFSMKKTHQNGDITYDKVRINRKKIIREGDFFKLSYLMKGEESFAKWYDYQCKTSWSFFGGHILETEWVKGEWSFFSLVSPLPRRTITFDADPESFAKYGIRAIHVKVYYTIGNKEQTKSITLKKDELSKNLVILLPKNVYEFEYKVNWKLKGNKRKSSGKLKTKEDYVWVGNLPKD